MRAALFDVLRADDGRPDATLATSFSNQPEGETVSTTPARDWERGGTSAPICSSSSRIHTHPPPRLPATAAWACCACTCLPRSSLSSLIRPSCIRRRIATTFSSGLEPPLFAVCPRVDGPVDEPPRLALDELDAGFDPDSSCAHSSYSETISCTISSTSDWSIASEARNAIGSEAVLAAFEVEEDDGASAVDGGLFDASCDCRRVRLAGPLVRDASPVVLDDRPDAADAEEGRICAAADAGGCSANAR